MEVKYSYLPEQFADFHEIFEKISRVIKTGDFTLGKEVAEFEEAFAARIGTKYAVGVNSGTDALFLSLKAAGIGPGDEVITSPNTFIATGGAIAATGARPVFVDITDEFVINPDLIEQAVTRRTRAIMPVHYAGVCCDMDRIMPIAHRHGLPVIEDSCQAIGAALNGKWAGSFGLAGGFSLHPLKNLNVWADSGIAVTDSETIRDHLILLRNHGLSSRDEVEFYGYNSRLDTVQAVVGLHLLPSLDWITQTRIKWAQRFDLALAGLGGMVSVPARRPNKRYVHHLYMFMAQDRNGLLAYLIDKGIEAKVHYPIPLHLQRCSAHLGYKEGDFPVTESQAKSIITLPVHQHLTEEQVDYMIAMVKEYYGK